MKKVIIDTDPGIDDAAAILFALRSVELDVRAITTVFGNVEVEQATQNALRILEAGGRDDIPVHPGAAKPLMRSPRYAKFIHGQDGLGDVGLPPPRGRPSTVSAPAAMIDLLLQSPDSWTVVALGPPTNIALALSLEPRIASHLQEIVCMGGAVFVMGNASPVASANFVNDPEAAYIVYHSGAPVTQVGLDVCEHVYITREQFAAMQSSQDPAAIFLSKISGFHAKAEERVPELARRWTKYGAGPWHHYNDIPAVGYAVAPQLFEAERLYVTIETKGETTSGETVADFRGLFGREANVNVCLRVTPQPLVQLFLDRLCGGR